MNLPTRPLRIPPFQLERFFSETETRARHHLSSSGMEPLTPGEFFALIPEAREEFEGLSLGYPDKEGGSKLRAALSELYAHRDAERIAVYSGAAEAIYVLMASHFGAGDHLIVHAPCYASLYEVARANGCAVDFWPARPENYWAPDLAELKGRVRPNTRAIVINGPHNPTGFHFPAETLDALVAFARRHGLWIVSDEAYRFLAHHSGDERPPICDLYERGVSIGSLSKAFALPGLRIGWVSAEDRRVLVRMSELRDYTTICANAPGQWMAEKAVANRNTIFSRNRNIWQPNLVLLEDFLKCHRGWLSWVRPQAGVIGFAKVHGESVPGGLFRRALEKCGVLLLPGHYYNVDNRDFARYFRVGFGRRDFEKSLRVLETFLAESNALEYDLSRFNSAKHGE